MSGEVKPLRRPSLRRVDDEGHSAAEDEPSVAPDALESSADLPIFLGSADRREAHRHERRAVPRTTARSLVTRVLLLLLLACAAALLLAPSLVRGDLPDERGLIGTPARAFVKADRDYALVDVDATGALRDAAAERSPSVWDLDTDAALHEAQVLHKALVRVAVSLEPLRQAMGLNADRGADSGRTLQSALQASEPVRAVLVEDLARIGLEPPVQETWRAIVKTIWVAPTSVDGLHEVLTRVLEQPVVADRRALARERAQPAGGAGEQGVLVRSVPARPGGERRLELSGIVDVAAARARVTDDITASLVGQAQALTHDEARLIGAFAAGLVRPTLTFNAAETDLRRRRGAEEVPPVIVRAHRGELVLRPGEVITGRHRVLVQAMRVQQADDMRTRAVLGTGCFVGLLCLVVYLFGARRVFRRHLRTRDIAFLCTLVLVVLLGIVAADVAAPFLESWAPGVPATVLFFAVPVALGAMTARLTLPPEVALLFSVVVALLGGVVVEPGMSWSVVAFVTSLTGAAGVSRSQRRSTLLLAGLGAGLVGAFAALTLELFRGALAGMELVWLLGATVIGGVLSGFLVVIATPVVEAIFGYVTEQRLYRIADLNHPLLKDLIVHAPGTWHHSMRVAELAEAAARSVGASPVLARAMALHHDVGKIRNPNFFSENQKHDNPHDRMAPEESAALIRAHVAEGVRLAEEHGLPRAVIAVIEEHHVDNVQEGFYARARAAADADAEVDVHRFRYAGRPPQTRESALVMLADQIEAAARSLDAPTTEALCGVVDAFVNRAIGDDTLVECDLSLRDIGRARDALQRALLRIHRKERP